MSAAQLDELIQRVIADRTLHERLLAYRDQTGFIEAVVDAAAELQLDVTASDVAAGLRAAREWWLMRWV
jgi:hypothetical protein